MTGLFLFLCILFPAFAVSFIPIYLALSKQSVISQRVLSIIFILSLAIIYANRITEVEAMILIIIIIHHTSNSKMV